MPIAEDANWLILLFEPQLTIGLTPTEPAELFTVSNQAYRCRAGGEIKATFDRLLDAKGLFIGLQVWPVAAFAGDLLSRLPRVGYLQFPPDVPCFQVFFNGRPSPDVESGGEQALSTEVYEADSGHLAMTFHLADIVESELEIRSIREAQALFIAIG